MNAFLKGIQLLVALVLIGTAGYLVYPHAVSYFTPACEKPLTYSIDAIDERFGVSRASLQASLLRAEKLWEEAAGRDLFVFASEGGIRVSLVYSEEQQTNELGEAIDSEQADYDAKKTELETLADAYHLAQRIYERKAAAFERRARAYEAEVQKYNSEGGAPPGEYERLQREGRELEEEQEEINNDAAEINALAQKLNEAVDALNAFGKRLNAKVDRYNEHAGDAFDQGDYQEDASGKRISVYEFSKTTDLERVLSHEFGHALGIGHVENPDSLMYSFNAGEELSLSQEDREALREVCGLDS